ncbi:restriction endonuclease subunit S [Xenorhabdus budapestensis]|uniref:restriction endonuclease subunit S n=1 Tax=Xenorhabdus budapestensis TaxID=290110 RepID=UPI003A868248
MSIYESIENEKASTIVGDDFQLPIGWKVYRFRNLFKFGKGLNITKENLQDDGIPCVNYGEVHSKYGFEVNPVKHELRCVSEYYLKKNSTSLLELGDFVFADTSEDIEGAGNFTQLVVEAKTFAGYHTVICRPVGDNNHRFLAYLLDSFSFRKQIRKSVKGVKVFSITKSILKNTQVWLPDINYQILIANFLDKKTAQLDEAIAIKEKQIALLEEHKQIIIQKVVTQGLDPNVPMKDSGVDWIGQIPAHWEISKLGSCLSSVSIKNHPELPLLSITREQGVIERDIEDQESNHNFIPDDLSGYKLIRKGQFGMNKMKAWQGSYGVSMFTGIVSPAYYVFTFAISINPDFFNWAIRSKLYVSFFGSASDGVRIGQWDLSKSRMKSIPFLLPCEKEQILLANFLDEKTAQIDEVIGIKEKQVEKLKEYKTSLINSAVTGKIKITPEMAEA